MVGSSVNPMERMRWPWTRILSVLVISQKFQMYLSTEVMAQFGLESFVSDGSEAMSERFSLA